MIVFRGTHASENEAYFREGHDFLMQLSLSLSRHCRHEILRGRREVVHSTKGFAAVAAAAAAAAELNEGIPRASAEGFPAWHARSIFCHLRHLRVQRRDGNTVSSGMMSGLCATSTSPYEETVRQS